MQALLHMLYPDEWHSNEGRMLLLWVVQGRARASTQHRAEDAFLWYDLIL
jgi:hypothetical protein